MLTALENTVLVIACVALSCVFLVILNGFWLPVHRRVHNDVIGWQIAIIGTIYAVMIGFMLYAVWGNYQTTEENVSAEASSTVNLFRTAEGLPAQQRDSIQKLSLSYVDAMISDEWPAMNRGKLGVKSKKILQQLWSVAASTDAGTNSQQTSLDHTFFALTALAQHRRVRQLQSESRLPPILWAVLIGGGIITIAMCCLIGSENVILHFVLIVAVSLMISLTLAAIADIDGPFRGAVRIDSSAFVKAQQTITAQIGIHSVSNR